MKNKIIAFFLPLLAFTAGAQGLNKEITIEKEIVLHEEGYFTIEDKYYTLTGQKIK